MKTKWPMVSLGDLAKITTGKLDANAASDNGEFPFFTCATNPRRIDSYAFDTEAVLVAGNGDLNVKYYHGKFNAYQRTYIIDPTSSNRLSARYGYRFLDRYVTQLRSESIGGVIKYIKLGNLSEAKVPLPPLEEQERIAEILDKADDLRKKRKESIEKLEQLPQAIFHQMFANRVDIPMVPLGEVVKSFRYGTSEKAGGIGPPVLRVPNIRWGSISTKELKYLKKSDFNHNHTVETGDLLFVRSNGNPDEIGRCSAFDPDKLPAGYDTYLYASYLIRARPDRAIANSSFLSSCFKSQPGRYQLKARSKTSAGQYNLNTKSLSSLKIPLPPLQVQQEFASKVEAVEQELINQREHLSQLDLLFNSLQQRAFSGDL